MLQIITGVVNWSSCCYNK